MRFKPTESPEDSIRNTGAVFYENVTLILPVSSLLFYYAIFQKLSEPILELDNQANLCPDLAIIQ